jgi:hypothetical protein
VAAAIRSDGAAIREVSRASLGAAYFLLLATLPTRPKLLQFNELGNHAVKWSCADANGRRVAIFLVSRQIAT